MVIFVKYYISEFCYKNDGNILFSHAEIIKDISKHFVGGDLTTSDFCKGIKG